MTKWWILVLMWLLATVMCSGVDPDSTKSVKVPVFSGKKSDFQIWWMRFIVFATIMGFAGVLKQTKHAHLPDQQEEGEGDSEDQKKVSKWNLTAMYNITLSFTTEGLMGIIYKAQTDDWHTWS